MRFHSRWFLSFFLSLNLCGLFNAKAILIEEYYLTYNWRCKGIHTFPKGIRLKVNVIVQLEFELINFKVAV